jgi:hypothetical protein
MATPALLPNKSSGSHRTVSVRYPGAQRLWLHLLLFVLTFLSTTMIGMRYMNNFTQGRPALITDQDLFPYVWVIHHWNLFFTGLPFSLTLLGILLTHEFGHYFACRYFGVKVSLPYLLPAPTLSGTCGAIIRLRSRIQSRAALIVIGAAGPIAGFVVAVFTAAIGLVLSRPVGGGMPHSLIEFHGPALVTLLYPLLHHLYPSTPASAMLPHPVFIASWIGLLITSLNLIPAGQLDGGHILYAMNPRLHRASTRIVIFTLMAMGFFFWIGWLFWALLLLWPGMRHPTVPSGEPVSRSQWALAPVCMGIFLLTGSIRPFRGVDLQLLMHRIHW